jgi:serine protease Do
MRGLGEVAERLRRSTVQVRAGKRERGGGSGVVWDAGGLILTNSHVARAQVLEVEFWDGRRLSATVTSRDTRRDLALLRVEDPGTFEAATLGDSDRVRSGELVIAVGNPLGFAGALSTGTVHSREGGWLRAAVQLAPGNSGGPLANATGEVIGINTAIFNGLGLAVPSNTARDFLRNGARPSLGVTLQPVHLGLQVLEVVSGGAADRANLRAGDILLTRYEELHAALDSDRPVLRLHFLRGDGRKVREAVISLRAPVGAAA